MKKIIILLSISSLFVVGLVFSLNKKDRSIDAQINTSNVSESNQQYKDKLSLDGEYIEGVQPLYIDGIIVVNKEYSLPKDYREVDLEKDAISASKSLMKAAQEDGIVIKIRSGYRSYRTQTTLYNNYVKRDGKEVADRYSAIPGHSEHQTGLAFDFTTGNASRPIGEWFTDTKQAKWLYENAHKYGFILRYPEGKEDITGYQYESWHYRYVGYEHSKYFDMNNLTLEEYLGLKN